MLEYLHDSDFLNALNKTHNKEIFARITSLNFNELPIEYIEGRITNSGAVNVDGNSVIRRTCSLSMVAQEVDINQYNWGLNHKFKLEVGIANTIDSRYPDICWFKQGIYLITSFSCSLTNNNYTISISGKDKGCLLNGEVSGSLPSSIDFGCIENYETFYEKVNINEETYEPHKYYIQTSDNRGYAITQAYKDLYYLIFHTLTHSNLNSSTTASWQLWLLSELSLPVQDLSFIATSKLDNLKSYQTQLQSIVFNGLSNHSLSSDSSEYPISNRTVVGLYRLANWQFDPLPQIYQLDDRLEFTENETYYAQGSTLYKEKIPLKTVIREAVHTYANEPYNNIIINDLDDYGMELLEYRGEEPMYLLHKVNMEVYSQMVWGDQTCRILPTNIPINSQGIAELTPSQHTNAELTNFKNLREYDHFSPDLNTHLGVKIISATQNDNNQYPVFTVGKFEFGSTPGYKITDLVYAGDLISNIGETLSSVLDKIKNMLVAFEYFYDLDGHFVFQQKKLYTTKSWNNIHNSNDGQLYAAPALFENPYAYALEDSEMVISFNNNPNLNNLRNDYSVWGKRKTASGAEVPVHMRIAFDKKPVIYKTIGMSLAQATKLKSMYPKIFTAEPQEYIQDSVIYASSELATYPNGAIVRDWRELIYQMALDWYKFNTMEDYGPTLYENNFSLWNAYHPGEEDNNPYLQYKTGYEQYYVDIQGFWRQLYDPNPIQIPDTWDNSGNPTHYIEEYDSNHWHINVTEAPELLNFWFDFYSGGDLDKYSVGRIGDRPKVVNDSNVKAIYYRATPTVIFTTADEYMANINVINQGYRYIFLTPQMENMFTISAQGKSAKDAIDDLMYTNSYCIESASITSLPVFYLEPNVQIYIKDKQTGINGAYIVTKFSLPLTYNGTMSITATKSIERII